MDNVTTSDTVSLALGIVFLLVRNYSTKTAKEEVQKAVNNKGNETQIKMSGEAEVIRDELNAISKRVENSIGVTVAERAAHSASMEEIRASTNVLAFNLKRVVAQVGLEWKDEVTTVHEPLKKE